MNKVHKYGTEVNLNGLRMFITETEEFCTPEDAINILRRDYYRDSDTPPIVVGKHLVLDGKWVAASSFIGKSKYHFPESLVKSYDVLDYARDVKDKAFSKYHILSMTPDIAIFSSLYGIITFFGDDEISSSGIDDILEAMQDRRTIPILTKKEVK